MKNNIGRLDYINPLTSNISEDFRWRQYSSKQINYERTMFPGGEINFVLDTKDMMAYDKVRINCYGNCCACSSDILNVILIKDALHRCGVKDIELFIPYMPFARQDRVCNYGEAFSLKVVADMINSANFSKVVVLDPHSDMVEALINNCQALSPKLPISQALESLRKLYKTYSDFVLVVPDTGAYKKVSRWNAGFLDNFSDIIVCNKTRELKTGEITSMTIIKDADIAGKNVIVVDDICDGGRTFIEIANLLKERDANSMSLYTTHGIYSQGLTKLSECYDNIFCTSSILSEYISLADKRVQILPCDFTIQCP